MTSAGVSYGQGCPEVAGRWPYGRAVTVATSGSTAYVGSGAVLLVLDVSIPSSVSLLGKAMLPGAVAGVAVVGSYA